MRRWEAYKSDALSGVISVPEKKHYSRVLILLHGVGANEQGLTYVGEFLGSDSLLISLRGPLHFGGPSFAWFRVQFTEQGPVHNWSEASQSLNLLEQEIHSISKKFNIPLEQFSILGFSQGSIMTMGLLLASDLKLGNYLCFSGRTLPEFKKTGLETKKAGKRKVFLTHGSYDDKLPVMHGRSSKEVLNSVAAELHYHEFSGGHEIPVSVLQEARKWLS